MQQLDAVVIGAGVIGIAVARALALAGRDVVLLEAERTAGLHTSSRNSEVIHAGIYYPEGSLKARTCVRGRELLYAYCRDHAIAHRRIGKLIVATQEHELPLLDAIAQRAAANGVDLDRLDARELRRREPALAAIAGLASPMTGIVDSHALMRAFLGDAERAGAMVAWSTRVLAIAPQDDGLLRIVLEDDAVGCQSIVNAAGLNAQALAQSTEGLRSQHVPPLHLVKGSYFALRGTAPFSTLIYPTPADASLGIHLTFDLAGAARFGPDQEWIPRIDYTVDPKRAPAFERAIRTWWPGLQSGVLEPGYAGIRPKVRGPGEPPGDFIVSGPSEHHIPGLVNLFGIESPGLTAALALAEIVVAALEG
jgi:L-2-hydroxyglutarate oxidase LhgO